MQKITVAISANGFTGLTAESIEKALNHYFGSPTLKVSFSVTEVVEFAALLAAGNDMANMLQEASVSVPQNTYKLCAGAIAAWERATK
jgi:hypothetical protein